MEKQLRQDVLDTLNSIKLPQDLVDIETNAVPMRNEVLLLKVYHGERTKKIGSIDFIVPEFEQVSQPIGRIVALGPECKSYLKKGMLVMFNTMTAQSVSISGIEYNLVDDYTGIKIIIVDEKKVEVKTEPVSPETIKRRERASRNAVIQKDMTREFDNKMDEIHEKANYAMKNPTLSKLKGK